MRTVSPLDVAFAWATLGLKWVEMMAASSQVIAHRTRRRNTPAQLFTMGSEKVEATLESYNAVLRHAMVTPPSNALAAWDAWARLLASGMAPFHARATRNARRGPTRRRR
jgi:hypothetical protein